MDASTNKPSQYSFSFCTRGDSPRFLPTSRGAQPGLGELRVQLVIEFFPKHPGGSN